jgi:hypothetical protein
MKEIPLTKGYVALVDDEDYEWLSQWKWTARKANHAYTAYATRWSSLKDGPRHLISMHRLIMGDPPGRQVDHWDTDGCNNQRGNLRVATRTQNNANRRKQASSSQYKGVSRRKDCARWVACIGKSRTCLGYFPSEIDAARAYDVAAKEMYGEFALTNGLG